MGANQTPFRAGTRTCSPQVTSHSRADQTDPRFRRSGTGSQRLCMERRQRACQSSTWCWKNSSRSGNPGALLGHAPTESMQSVHPQGGARRYGRPIEVAPICRRLGYLVERAHRSHGVRRAQRPGPEALRHRRRFRQPDQTVGHDVGPVRSTPVERVAAGLAAGSDARSPTNSLTTSSTPASTACAHLETS